MKKILFLGFAGIIMLSGCASEKQITKAEAYKGFYQEKPVTVLIMPPINRTENVEAKDIFHSTLSMPICNAGYYVIPPFLSMEILKRESAYDAELFLDAPLTKFGETFGADLALFTIIDKWKKTTAIGKINVEIEYIFKSTKTNEIVYQRQSNITLNPNISYGFTPAGLIIAAASTLESVIANATTDNAIVGSMCNNHTLCDLPAGPYSPLNGKDGDLFAGKKEFKENISGKINENIVTGYLYSPYTKEKKKR